MNNSVLILLAEDEALIAIDVQDALENAGFSVRHVVDGEDAILYLDNNDVPTHALITDIQLRGGVDGWAVARHARERVPHVPVVYMSGNCAHEHTIHGVPDSVMLQKPFASAQVITAISTLLNAMPPQQPE